MTGGVKFDLSGDDVVGKVFTEAPRTAYRWLREYVFQAFQSHRQQWRKVRAIKLASPKNGGLTISLVGKARKRVSRRSVDYDVNPIRRASSAKDAVDKLRKFDAEIRTGSEALEGHEFGRTITSNKFMTVPIGTRSDIDTWKRKNPDKRLVWIPTRSGYAVSEESGVRKKKLRLRWILTKKVVHKPKLKFYDTWERLKTLRTRQWKNIVTDMVIDMERGKG